MSKQVFSDFGEAFKERKFTSSIISCEEGHELAVLKSYEGEEEQFSKDWMDSFHGTCPRCSKALNFKIAAPEVYDLWASREDGRAWMGHGK